MATNSTSVSPAVKDIGSALSLVEGTTYTVQYLGGGSCFLHVGDSAPLATTETAFRLYDGELGLMHLTSGMNGYAWCNEERGGVVVVDTLLS